MRGDSGSLGTRGREPTVARGPEAWRGMGRGMGGGDEGRREEGAGAGGRGRGRAGGGEDGRGRAGLG